MDIPSSFVDADVLPNAPLCQFLTWDTDFFGRRIGLVRGNYLTAERVRAIDAWAHENAIDCLYFLANTDNPPTIRLAEDAGFRFQSVRTWIERTLDDLDGVTLPPIEGLILRPCRESDMAVLRPIARHAYTWTRFYSDPRFTQEQCELLYDIWLERSIRKEIADEVIVAEQHGVPVGYMTCKLPTMPDSKDGVLMLLGVDEQSRGNKLGQRITVEALHWFARHGMDIASLATQGHNVAVMRFYERLGFTTRSTQFWYHKWYNTHI